MMEIKLVVEGLEEKLHTLDQKLDLILVNQSIIISQNLQEKTQLTVQGAAMTQQLDDLKTEVGEMKSAVESAEALLDALTAKVEALKDDPVALQQLVDDVRQQRTELAQSVAKNTPAEEPPAEPGGGGGEEPPVTGRRR